MDTDPCIANWVLEFLLRRQSLENQTLKFLLRALLPSNDNYNLKKLFLLKKLESDISLNAVSETILDLLDHLEQIEFLLGNENVSDTMRRAYCAAAVECTVKNLKVGGCENEVNRYKFFEVVRRVWKGKVERMKKLVEKGGLGSEALWAWKDEIEEAVFDDAVCDSVVKKSEGVNGVEAVNAYIREEREKMGPSFLEVVAEKVKRDKILQRILGVDGIHQENGVADGSNTSKEMNKGRSRGLASAGVNINETTSGPSHEVAGSADVDEAEEALQHPPKDNHATAAAPGGNMSNEPRPSLMERNNTTRPRECDESIDGSQEDKNLNLKKRRKARKWSLLEEDTLRTAVEEHGKGFWKEILIHNRDTFEGRTEVDLKDKWRNMTRYY